MIYRTHALLAVAVGCGSSSSWRTQTEDHAFVVSDVMLGPDGGFTATPRFSATPRFLDAGVYRGCEDFCARVSGTSATFLACEGPVPIDTTLGPNVTVVAFDDGGMQLRLPFQNLPVGAQAIRCTMQIQVPQPTDNGCGGLGSSFGRGGTL